MVFATLGLSIPLMIRVAYECLLVYHYDDERDCRSNFKDMTKKGCDYEKTFVKFQNFIFFIVCIFVPSSFQFASMIFAYIKQKDSKSKQTAEGEDLISSYSSSAQSTASFFEPELFLDMKDLALPQKHSN